MARLIIKSPYFKGGGSSGKNAAGYLRYIATRERVELLPDDRPPTHKQEQFIKELVRDFPDSKSSASYAEYMEKPTKYHASEFISSVLESHWPEVSQSEAYMKYIAARPRAERSDDRVERVPRQHLDAHHLPQTGGRRAPRL